MKKIIQPFLDIIFNYKPTTGVAGADWVSGAGGAGVVTELVVVVTVVSVGGGGADTAGAVVGGVLG